MDNEIGLYFVNGRLAKVQFLPVQINLYNFNESLARARADNIKLLHNTKGQTFATSASNPGTIYEVTIEGCECPGFQNRSACKHYAAFLVEEGLLNVSDTQKVS